MRTKALAALLCCSFLLPAAEVLADVPTAKKGAAPPRAEEASDHFRSGVAFYKDRDFAAALVEFKRAYELAPNYRVLFNLGQTARELKDYASALGAFERYLREGGTEVAAARRKDLQGQIDELKRKVGRLKITTNVDGAEITVDDQASGVTPLAEAVVLNVGRHKIGASLTGYTPVQRVVEVAGAGDDTVAIELAKIEKPVVLLPSDPQNPALPPPPPPKLPTPTAVWIVLGVTGASAVATGVLGGLAIGARGALKDALNTFPGDEAAIADAQKKTKSMALGADIAGAITLAGAVSTLVVYGVAPRAGDKPAPASAKVGVWPGGLVVSGSF